MCRHPPQALRAHPHHRLRHRAVAFLKAPFPPCTLNNHTPPHVLNSAPKYYSPSIAHPPTFVQPLLTQPVRHSADTDADAYPPGRDCGTSMRRRRRLTSLRAPRTSLTRYPPGDAAHLRIRIALTLCSRRMVRDAGACVRPGLGRVKPNTSTFGGSWGSVVAGLLIVHSICIPFAFLKAFLHVWRTLCNTSLLLHGRYSHTTDVRYRYQYVAPHT